MELTQRIANRPKERLTHKRCQELRRRVMKCSTSFSALGDFMLDFDLEQADTESLFYIAQLLIKHGNFRAWQYYVNTSLKGLTEGRQEAVKALIRANIERYDAKRDDAQASLEAYQVGLLNDKQGMKL